MTLPVIDCPKNNVGNCSELVGAVNVDVAWMIKKAGAEALGDWVPLKMDLDLDEPGIDWTCPEGTDPKSLSDEQFLDCWYDFVERFDLVNYQGVSVDTFEFNELNKTMYFLPNCKAHIPTGGSGGRNFAVLAKLPVLEK